MTKGESDKQEGGRHMQGWVALLLKKPDGSSSGAEVIDASGNRFFTAGAAVKRFGLELGTAVTFRLRPPKVGARLPYADITAANIGQLRVLLPPTWQELLSQPKPEADAKPTKEQDASIHEVAADLLSSTKSSWSARVLEHRDFLSHPRLAWMLDRGVALAYVQTGDESILKRFAPRTGDGSLTAYLDRYPHARSALCLLYQFSGTLAHAGRHTRGTEQFYGWVDAALVDDRHPLPDAHQWRDVLGHGPVRWKVWLGSQAPPPERRNDFAEFDAQLVIVNTAQLSEQFDEDRVRALDNDRGLRSITLSYQKGQAPKAGHFARSLCASLRRNVDIFARRAVHGSAFFGRDVELARIEDHLAGGYGVAIVGARRSGKSTLARQFSFLLDGIRPPLLSLDTTSLREADVAAKIANLLNLTTRPTSYLQLLSALRVGAAGKHRRTLVIDEFGSAFECIPGTPGVADALALARFVRMVVEDQALRIVLCNPRSNIYTDPYLRFGDQIFDNPLLDRVHRVHLCGLDAEAAQRLLDHYCRRTLCRVTSKLKETIVAETGAFPVLLRAALHSATNDRERPMSITEEHVTTAFRESSADTTPWGCTDSFFFQWALGWAKARFSELTLGEPSPSDAINDELVSSGIMAASRQVFAFPLLERVARARLFRTATANA